MNTKDTLEQFDRFLSDQGLTLQATLVDGAALNLLGVIDRETRDCDIIHPDLPESIIKAAANFADKMRKDGIPLQDDWLNNGPTQLGDVLPKGWMKRTRPAFSGQTLELATLERSDLLKTKLFAYCDRGTDLDNCLALKPTLRELDSAREWLTNQDAHPDWPRHVDTSLTALAKRLGYEL